MLIAAHRALSLQCQVDHAVQFRSRLVIRRDHKRPFRLRCIASRDFLHARITVTHFVDTALLLEFAHRFAHSAPSQLLDHVLQSFLLLPHDLIQPRGSHAGCLQLLERLACVYCLVLPRIADQQHPLIRSEAAEELVHLTRARQARFIKKVQPLRRAFVGSRTLRQMML